MNDSELEILTNYPLSNEAKVLYCLGLRPGINHQTGESQPLNYKKLLHLLNGKEEKLTLGRQINSLLKELHQAQLITLDSDQNLSHSFNGKKLCLPLAADLTNSYQLLHMQWSKMTMHWCPNLPLLDELAKLVGIIDCSYSPEELGDFVAYWLGRPEKQFSDFQWTQKFVFHLKQKRLISGKTIKHQVGHQLVTPQATVEADDNAKQLVAKYSRDNREKP